MYNFGEKAVEVNVPNGLRTRVSAFHCLFFILIPYEDSFDFYVGLDGSLDFLQWQKMVTALN